MRVLDTENEAIPRPSPISEFLESPAGVRAQGGVIAVGGGAGAYAAYGAVAGGAATLGLGLALSFGLPAIVVGGYVIVTADAEVLEALKQAASLFDKRGLVKKAGKEAYERARGKGSSNRSGADFPTLDPDRLRDPHELPSSEHPEAPMPDLSSSPELPSKPDPVEIDPPRPRETPEMQPPVRVNPEFQDHGWHDVKDHGADDSGGSGEGGGEPNDPCADQTGSHPDYCD